MNDQKVTTTCTCSTNLVLGITVSEVSQSAVTVLLYSAQSQVTFSPVI